MDVIRLCIYIDQLFSAWLEGCLGAGRIGGDMNMPLSSDMMPQN